MMDEELDVTTSEFPSTSQPQLVLSSPCTTVDQPNTTALTAGSSDLDAGEPSTSNILVKRKRGRPRRSADGASHVAATPQRSNPVRAARQRTTVVDERDAASNGEETSTTTKRPLSASTRRRRATAATAGVKRPRGRPPKAEEKPRCVVRPMQRMVENKPRDCKWASCSHTAASTPSLKMHVERDHLGHLTQFLCRWGGCTRIEPFKAVYMLRLHLRTHLGDKPYTCTFPYCTKTYTRLENMKTHVRTHTGERPYTCAVCRKAFSNASDRAKHQNRTHVDMKNYKCPVDGCSMSKCYTDPSSLRKHIITSHGKPAYTMAKMNKQLSGRNGNYGFVPLLMVTPDATAAPPLPRYGVSRSADSHYSSQL